MADPFVHLHVASGYSLRHGASTPAALVARAAEHEMDALALTDRDGAYGAVKFATAAAAAGIRPILGVDLALSFPNPSESPSGAAALTFGHDAGGGTGPARRSPARGGVVVDPRLPRVTVLAHGRAGWASVCRLISAVHLSGERGDPVADPAGIAEHGDAVTLLLGPASDVGRWLARRRPDRAAAALRRWRNLVSDCVIEVACHRGPDDLVRAARLLRFAADQGVPAVLTNMVRCADRGDGP